MFEKQGKFYADWRDRKGKRTRKSFTSEKAALWFEAEMKEAAHPKQKARGKVSPIFSAPKPGPAHTQQQRSRHCATSPKVLEMKGRRK